MSEWYELRLWHAHKYRSPNDLFEYKKISMIPLLTAHPIANFSILDEPEFVLFRIETDERTVGAIKSSLEESMRPLFSKITVEKWSATHDAKSRVLSAKERLKSFGLTVNAGEQEGWAVRGADQAGKWIITPENLDRQVLAFSTFMTRVLGHFTEHYLREMPYRVEDRWLMSLFLHLMLDSISTWQPEEAQIRQFPYI